MFQTVRVHLQLLREDKIYHRVRAELTMKISVNVPSYKRSMMVETFKILPSANYWVHDFEAQEYRKANYGMDVKVLPDEIKGNIARVRNYILKQAFSTDADVVVMVDDDVDHFAYWQENKRVKIFKEAEIMDFIDRYSNLAREWGVRLWGVNVNNDKQVYREYTPFSTLCYISGSFSCFLPKRDGKDIFYDERFSLKEDYDMTIAQLNKFRSVLRVNKFYYMKKGAQQTGGCAVYRNVEKELAQIEALRSKWGGAIVSVDKGERNHKTEKNRAFDINPVVRVPIRGV